MSYYRRWELKVALICFGLALAGSASSWRCSDVHTNRGTRAVKCISIKQPWATLIIQYGKIVENRTRGTRYRGDLLIHASLSYDHEGDMYLHSMPVFSDIPSFVPHQLPKGCIIGKAKLIDCVRTHPSRWFCGPFGLVLNDTWLFLEPIPYKGALGLFDVPGELIESRWIGKRL